MEMITEFNPVHIEALAERTSKLFNSGAYSDISFSVEGNTIKCHKLILATTCPYFDKMFQSQLTNSDVIEITTMTYENFSAILAFIYTGKLEFSEQNAQILLHNSDMMGLVDLKSVMMNYFIAQMDPTNCLGFYHMAHVLSAEFLEKRALDFALENFDEVIKHEDFMEMPLDIIRYYLGIPNLNTNSEDTICAASIAWILHKPGERLQLLSELLSVIRLENLSPDFIHYSILSNEILNKEPISMTILQAVFKHILFYIGLPMTIKCNFPRTGTNIVPGIAMLWQSRDDESTTTQTNIGFFSFRDTETFAMQKIIYTNKDFRYLDTRSSNTAFVIDNCVYCPAGRKPRHPQFLSGLYKYNITSNNLTFHSLPGLSDSHVVIIAAQKDLSYGAKFHAIEVSNIISCKPEIIPFVSVVSYLFDKDIWVKQLNESKSHIDRCFSVREGYFTACVYKERVYIFGVACLESHQNTSMDYTQIISFETNSSQSHIHKVKLPNKLSHMKCCVYRDYVFIFGKEETIAINLANLNDECQNIHDSIADNLQQMSLNIATCHSINNHHNSIILCSKLGGITGSRYQIHIVSNQLVLIYGKVENYSEKDILCVNIEDFLANQDGIKWTSIGQISDDIITNDVCITAGVYFQQSI